MHKPIELAQNLTSRYPPLYRLSRNEGEGLLASRQCILSSMTGVIVVEVPSRSQFEVSCGIRPGPRFSL